MKRLSLIFVLFAVLSLLASCDVHEFPEQPESPKNVALRLKLHYETDMPQWEYPITEARTVIHSKSVQTTGEMRYIIRLYPLTKSSRSEASQEFVFTRNVADGYDAEFTLDVPAGSYTVMVWSDLTENTGGSYRFYDAGDFSQIVLQGDHEGNNDYRDAFRGTQELTLAADIMEKAPETVEIEMVRPMAKFEFVATDVEAFIDKEVEAALSRGENVPEDAPSRGIDIEDYKVVFHYVGFMPNTFNMFTDKPSDSVTGVSFPGRISRLDNGEASLGFDYVFVNGVESAVSVQVGIYDKDGNRLSMTNPITVPLRRSKHTLLKGEFLMQNASGGVSIDPSYNGDHNIIL